MGTWWQLVQLVWNRLMAGDPFTIATVINAVAIVLLVIVTLRYVSYTRQLVQETRIARRDDPELKVYLRKLSQDDMKRRQIKEPSGTLLTFDALIINPGAVPVVIEEVIEEIIGQESKKEVTTPRKFALPKGIRAELIGIYIFILPWVIPSDGFAIWSRYLELDGKIDSNYILNVKFNYSVAGKPKSMTTGPFSLTSWHRGG